jgi:SMODS and SLOG-associating 2TM effector domain 2
LNDNKSGRKGKASDIKPSVLHTLDWRPEQAAKSLDAIYEHVVEDSIQAVTWYLIARRSKKQWAQILRVAAIIMVATAGVLPVLSQIFSVGGTEVIQPAWASVALAIAVALVALDRFFGFSNAWSRYMATGQEISAALNQFRFDWQAVQATYQSSTEGLTSKEIVEFLELAKGLAEKTDDLIRAETSQWVKEFRETLTEIERAANHKHQD